MAEQITARIARACRAAAEGPKRRGQHGFVTVLSQLAGLAERQPETAQEIVAVLLRELAPEPDDAKDTEWREMVNAFVQDNLGSTDLAYGFLMGALSKLHKQGIELDRARAENAVLREAVAAAGARDAAAQAVVAAAQAWKAKRDQLGYPRPWSPAPEGSSIPEARALYDAVDALDGLDGLVRAHETPHETTTTATKEVHRG